MRREWQPEELIECWTLLDDDRRLVANKTGATRLGFALLLKFFEEEGRFPRSPVELPAAAVEYVAAQVKVPVSALDAYQWSGSTIEYHRSQIRSELGFREATVADERLLADWLAREVGAALSTGRRQGAGTTTENTTAPPVRGRGPPPVALPTPYAAVLDDYTATLQSAPLSDQTRRTYTSKVRQFLAWLAAAGLDADPLTSADGRDWAVRDYRTHLQAVLKRSPATVNNALAAVDDFYIRRGLGPASAARVEIAATAPRALDQRAQLRYLREVQRCGLRLTQRHRSGV